MGPSLRRGDGFGWTSDISVDVQRSKKHLLSMLVPLLLAAAVGAAMPSESLPHCVPVPSDKLQPTASDIEEHTKLRQALKEPMPDQRPMVMLRGKGGHLSTEEYSIIVARSPNGQWHGTAVGRSKIRIGDAPFKPMKRAEWVLDKAIGKRLDKAISRTCPFNRDVQSDQNSGPPPLGDVSEKIDVVSAKGQIHSFHVGSGGEGFAALIRPPR